MKTDSHPRSPRFGFVRRRGQAGLTLVELMVAMALGLLVTLASVAALIIARQGFTSVDNGAQLRENARFASSVLERIGIQAGFEDLAVNGFGANKDPGLRGYDNAVVGDLAGLPDNLAHNTRTTACGAVTDTSCVNGSDVLVVRYWGASKNGGTGGAADGSMINCAGIAEPNLSDRAFSIFHVVRSDKGEPTLACTYRDPVKLTFFTVPLVQGVEAFQVLYGVDGITAAGKDAGAFIPTAPTDPPTALPWQNDTVADRYLRAEDVNKEATYSTNNWSRVRSLRIGLVIRGEVGSALQRTTAAFDVLGPDFTSDKDPLSELSVPADGRLRQHVVLTIHLRNSQF